MCNFMPFAKLAPNAWSDKIFEVKGAVFHENNSSPEQTMWEPDMFANGAETSSLTVCVFTTGD